MALDPFSVEAFARLTPEEQRNQLSQWNDAYYNADISVVSDAVYDACINYYNLNNPPMEYLGATGDFEKYEHPYPVLSLGKINTKEDYDKTLEKFDYNVLIQPKVDGLTVVYYPDGKLVSRGDGHIGEVLPWAHLIPGLPEPMDKPVRMEVYISKDNFAKYFAASGKNARNMAAGILRRKEYSQDIKRLSYVAYNILGSDKTEFDQRMALGVHGFYAIDFLSIYLKETADALFDRLEKWSKEFPYETDGIVIKSDEGNLEERYGHTAHHPNGMVAFKFKSAVAKTVLRDIEWSYGRDKITPVAIFDPVDLGGTTVSRASLHNLNIMRALNIKIGANVYVTKKNEIIPQIIKCDSDSFDENLTYVKCPECGSTLIERDNGELYCDNLSCPGQIIEDCIRMSSKDALDIKGLSEQTWRSIIKEVHGMFTPFMLITMAKEYLEHPDDHRHYGMTNKVWTKLCQAVVSAAEDVPMDRFLVACNVPLLGRTASKAIAEFCHYSMDEFWEKRAQFGEIDGIGDAILSNIEKNKTLIEGCSQFVTFKTVQSTQNTEVLKFVITGTLSKPRADFKKRIEEKGWTVSDSVSKNIDYVVCGEKAGSKKAKAEKLGIRVLTEGEFENLMKES